jgi:plasmid stability protein
VPPGAVPSLRAFAWRHSRAVEQEVRERLEGCLADRRAALDQTEAGWQAQTRPTTAAEADPWMALAGHQPPPGCQAYNPGNRR